MKERYEQEIEQLLSELESESNSTTNPPRPDDSAPPLDDQPSPFTPRPRQAPILISPVKLAIAGAVLAIVGLLLPVLKWLSLAGLGIMVGAVVWMVVRRMGSQQPSYWRGRRVDEPPQGAWQRFRHWLSK